MGNISKKGVIKMTEWEKVILDKAGQVFVKGEESWSHADYDLIDIDKMTAREVYELAQSLGLVK
jgi:hypothetical protein